jgi:transcriptional repressor NrdR
MKCPFCNLEESKVLDKRETESGITVRRRRECLGCEKRYTTYERIEVTPVIILKRDGRRENFNRDKLRKGLLKACEKRNVDCDQIELVCDELELKLRNYKESEIKSTILGKWVMSKLKKMDKVAYIRYASVYKDFADIEELGEEVQKLIMR